jgi:hypothetical protein
MHLPLVARVRVLLSSQPAFTATLFSAASVTAVIVAVAANFDAAFLPPLPGAPPAERRRRHDKRRLLRRQRRPGQKEKDHHWEALECLIAGDLTQLNALQQCPD